MQSENRSRWEELKSYEKKLKRKQIERQRGWSVEKGKRKPYTIDINEKDEYEELKDEYSKLQSEHRELRAKDKPLLARGRN